MIGKCLEKDRQNRFRDGAELAAELNQVRTEIETDRVHRSQPKHTKSLFRSQIIWAAGVFLLFALLVSTFAYLKVWRNRSTIKPVEIHSLAVLPLDEQKFDFQQSPGATKFRIQLVQRLTAPGTYSYSIDPVMNLHQPR